MWVLQRKGVLLLSIWLGLIWAQQNQSAVPVQPGFQPEQEGGAFHCFMTNIRVLENGNLNVTYFHRKDGKCVKEFYIAEKTDTPGRYTFEYQGTVYLTFVVLNKDVAIIDLENHSEDGTLIVAELHGRSLSAGSSGLDAYRKHTARRGLEQSDTVDLLLQPRCDSPES